MTPWNDADRIADTLVDLFNAEIQKGTLPLQFLMGLSLAILALERTMPRDRRPRTLSQFLTATRAMAEDISENAESEVAQ